MTDLKIYGNFNSPYVRTALMAALEKGVPYENIPVGGPGGEDLKGPAHMARHPFGKIPAMTHGPVTLFESLAIARYIDEAFEGPRLQPKAAAERARMTAWASAYLSYMTSVMVGEFIGQFLFPSGPEGKPDLGRIDAARPQIRAHCVLLDRALEGRTWLAGDEGPTVADLMLLPPLYYIGHCPGGMASFDGLGNLYRWWEAISARTSFAKTEPAFVEHLKAMGAAA